MISRKKTSCRSEYTKFLLLFFFCTFLYCSLYLFACFFSFNKVSRSSSLQRRENKEKRKEKKEKRRKKKEKRRAGRRKKPSGVFVVANGS